MSIPYNFTNALNRIQLEEHSMTDNILTGFISHETATFSQRSTTMADFQNSTFILGNEIPEQMQNSNMEPAGFIKAAEIYDWQLIHTVAAVATPSGPVTQDAWDVCSGAILDAARAHKYKINGVLLGLHGAMAIESDFDAEGQLLENLRHILGSNIPIAATLDLHANVTDRMVENSDILSAYRTHPHVDQIATVMRAAKLLYQTLRGLIHPITIIARRAMVTGLDYGRTTATSPMTELLAQADILEAQDPKLLTISLCAGFRLTDIEQAGPSVTITSNGGNLEYTLMADHFMNYAWKNRHFDSNTYLTTDQCMTKVQFLLDEKKPSQKLGPIVIADHADNPGSGAYGDSTYLLKSMLDAKLTNAAFGTLYDPIAAQTLAQAGVGAEVSLFIGGKTDPRFGPPIFVTGRVLEITDGRYQALGPYVKGSWQNLGQSVVLHIAGIDVLIASNCIQTTEIETFSHANINVFDKTVVTVKSKQHFRAAFEPIARTVLIVDCGALSTNDLSTIPYKNLRRPIYPLDLD